MIRSEVDEFDDMIDSALDAGRAAARVYRTVDEALAEWPLIEAFREGFSQEAMSYGPSLRTEPSWGRPVRPTLRRQS